MNGVLIIDKPGGLTSHDVVNRVRRILGEKSVGHLGTLDPMATGVLPLVIGNFTRLSQFYLKSEKTYEGTIRFGFATDTYDAEGEPTTVPQNVEMPLETVRELARRFTGLLEQMPPPFSAKKIKGVPAYKLARKNKEVALEPVQIEIKEFEIMGANGGHADFRARVSSGTYIRSIAHEIGKSAGCGAHLAALRRTLVDEFALTEAHTLEDLKNATAKGMVEDIFIHPRKLLPDLPCVTATDQIAGDIQHGRAVNLPDLSRAKHVKVFRGQKDLIAIANRIAGTLFHPKIVLVTNETAAFKS